MGQDLATNGEPPSPQLRLMVFMFTDVADSTKLKQPENLGAAAYAELASKHDALFRQIVASVPDADVCKDNGDGFMATFPTATQAVLAALRFQYAVNNDPAFSPTCSPLPFRVRLGIHQGEVSVLDLDIHGKAKLVGSAADMAARLQSLSLPGQILISRAAFDNARQYVREHPACGELNVCPMLRWDAHGYYRFKGVPEPQEVFEVGVENGAPSKAPVDTEKALYIGSPDDEAMRGWRPALGQMIPLKTSWVLERKIGEGGFGEVWLANHYKTRERRVFKFCFSADRLRSFKRELTLFKLLNDALGTRNDIARVLDVSLETPPYMLESQYEAGGNLLDWAQTQGGIGTLSLADRVEILAKIADAVAAAHSVGVLHKDLKPSNILVHERNGKPQPVLADFGIGILTDKEQLRAHAVTDTGFTIYTENDSSRTGTRLYMPPELLAGKAFTAQGDVYAMGVILYQLAVGDLTRPLSFGWERDIANPMLREEIAACVDGDPQRRISSAAYVVARLRDLHATLVDPSAPVRKKMAAAPFDEGLIASAAAATEHQTKKSRSVRFSRTWTAAAAVILMAAGVAVWLALGHFKLASTPNALTATNTVPTPKRYPVKPGDSRDQHLAALQQEFADSHLSADQVQLGQKLLAQDQPSEYDAARLAEFNKVLEGRSPADKLQVALDAVPTPEQRAQLARQTRLTELMATARGNDDDAHAPTALAALDQVLTLDPANTAAQSLKTDIADRLQRAADARAAAEKQAKLGQLLQAAHANNDYVHAQTALTALNEAVKLDPDNADAQAGLGQLYYHGWGVAKDYRQAFNCFLKSSGAGNARGQAYLGGLYLSGLGTFADRQQGLTLLQKSATQGDEHALTTLAWVYQLGIGVPKDAQMAVTLFQKAADKGDAAGQLFLGVIYSTGWFGTPADYPKGRDFLQKSADQGNPGAQFELGFLYENALGVEKDIQQAASWYQKAAAAGDERARRRFDALAQR